MGVRTLPSPDAFDPYGVLEGFMGTTNFNCTINQSGIIVNGSANKLANAPDNKVQLLATKHGWCGCNIMTGALTRTYTT